MDTTVVEIKEIENEMRDILFDKAYDFLIGNSYIDFEDNIKCVYCITFDFVIDFSNKNGVEKSFSFDVDWGLDINEDDLEVLRCTNLVVEPVPDRENKFVIKLAK